MPSRLCDRQVTTGRAIEAKPLGVPAGYGERAVRPGDRHHRPAEQSGAVRVDVSTWRPSAPAQTARAMVGNLRGRMTDSVSERYVKARELATMMGVSVRTVNRFTAEGMPSETWGMSRTRRFLPSEALAWAQARGTIGRQPGPRPQRTRITSPPKE